MDIKVQKVFWINSLRVRKGWDLKHLTCCCRHDWFTCGHNDDSCHVICLEV